VQSGLPEARQSRSVERFLDRLPARLAGREVLPWWRIRFFLAMKTVGFADKSWNNLLKKNGAWAERFDQPYAPSAEGTQR
jgi:hypothetical protein